MDDIIPLYDQLGASAFLVERDGGVASVSGPDRVSWLQGMVSNDVARLTAGEGCYAAYLNARGRVLGLMIVLADPESLWLQLDQDVAAIVSELDKLLIMEDAEIRDRSGDYRVLSIVGHRARDVIQGWAGTDLNLNTPYRHAMAHSARVVRAAIGYDLIVGSESMDRTVEALVHAGARLAPPALWGLLSLEAGVARYGIDADETTTLPELGEDAIDYGKGCYVGQEVVAKVKHIGHVNRHFVGLRLEGKQAPSPGSAVFDGSREIGKVTRSGFSPALQSAIALSFVKRGHETPGTAVDIVTDGQVQAARVSALPFVERGFH